MIANTRYNKAVAIVASDSTNFTGQGTGRGLCDAIYCGGAGVVPVVFEDGTVVNFSAIAGGVIPVAAKRVNSTNLTASNLVALYGL